MNIDLTHPEILTIEQLQKFVGSDRTNDKYELIQLFYKYIAPLPQRKFRSNRLGLILTESQKQIRGDKSDLLEYKLKLNPLADGLDAQTPSEKHQSDRGIYTITMQNSGKKNTAPIKLKRSNTTTIPVDDSKRMKFDT